MLFVSAYAENNLLLRHSRGDFYGRKTIIGLVKELSLLIWRPMERKTVNHDEEDMQKEAE